MINLLNLEENRVSTDLTQYSMVWIGNSGEGKSMSLNKFLTDISPEGKKPLFLMTEDRFQNIPNIMAVKINSISDLKSAINQLKNPKLKEKYSSVVIDTIDKFEELCEQYVTEGHDVSILDEVGAFGKGTRYFKKVLRAIGDIRNLGYPVHFVAQSTVTKDIEKKTEIIDMKLSKNTLSYIKEGAFLLGYLWKESKDGKEDRYVTFSKSAILPNLKDTFGLPLKINVSDLKVTLEKVISSYGEVNITSEKTITERKEGIPFKDLVKKGNDLGGLLATNGHLDEALAVLKQNISFGEEGKIKSLDDLNEGQLEILKVVVLEFEGLVEKYNIQ
jgi:nucleoside-triphosphatase THEP1